MMTPKRLIRTVQEFKTRHGMSQQQTLDALSDALRAFIHDSSGIFLDLPRLSNGLYSRALLNDPEDDFQIVVVFWSPGQESPIHDHAKNLGVVAGLFGETEETKYCVLHRGDTTQLEPLSPTRLGDTNITPLIDDDEHQLHSIKNPSGHEWAATVHVYLNAMRTFNVYQSVSRDHYLPAEKPLWFDTHRFWQRWSDIGNVKQHVYEWN